MADSLLFTSSYLFRYCPICGSRVEHERIPVRSQVIDGERVTTKENTRTVCPEHGELIVK